MKKRILAILTLVTLLTISSSQPIYAANINHSVNNTQTSKSAITRAEVTGYLYRVVNGVLEKRLWSYTRGVWVDSHWSKA